ncbi:18704_t:CDS:2 [Entrophospora sp. SA101]|nr:18704_t:CDS:2 [Entrophospora sp. SA101]
MFMAYIILVIYRFVLSLRKREGNEEIVVQGDVSDDLYRFILDTWPNVPEKNIELTEEKPKK